MPLPLLEAMRPHQWVKNLLVFAPLLFSRRYVEADCVLAAAGAFVTFCLLASSVYLINDVVDRHADAQHAVKRHRPVASGRLAPAHAIAGSAGAGTLALVLALVLTAPGQMLPFVLWPLLYLALNLAYSVRLKRIVIVDALCIALGFQFRVHAGSTVIGVETSKWLELCTFFFATFLAFCKRREETEHHTQDGRAVLRHYTLPFLDQIIAPMAASSILAYAMYSTDDATVAKHGPYLILTVPLVVFGVFRYLWLVHNRREGANPSRLLFTDRQLLLSGVLWLSMVLAVLALGRPGG